MDELTLAIVGIDYPNADKTGTSRRMELLLCKPGDPVELRPEPENEHDEYAIAVLSERGVQVGYLTAERAPYIGKRIGQGEEVVALYQGLVGTAGYVRVRFGGGAPTLPPPTIVATGPGPVVNRAGEDFYPDPEGPEWGA